MRLPLAQFATPALAAGQFWNIRCDATGAIAVSLAGSTGMTGTPADNFAAPGAILEVMSFPMLYDGATWDLWRATQVAGAANMTEMLAPGAEDNTNANFAIIEKLIAANTYAPTLYTNFGASTAALVKASAGNVLALRGTNTNAASRYLQLHNKASGAPSAGEVPLYSFRTAAGSATAVVAIDLGFDFFRGSGGAFSTGIGIAWSTTEATYTAATAGDHQLHLHYK